MVRYVPDLGYEIEPDQRLILRTAEELGLSDAKPTAAPAVKDGGPALS